VRNWHFTFISFQDCVQFYRAYNFLLWKFGVIIIDYVCNVRNIAEMCSKYWTNRALRYAKSSHFVGRAIFIWMVGLLDETCLFIARTESTQLRSNIIVDGRSRYKGKIKMIKKTAQFKTILATNCSLCFTHYN
jgi:hypothetical protein